MLGDEAFVGPVTPGQFAHGQPIIRHQIVLPSKGTGEGSEQLTIRLTAARHLTVTADDHPPFDTTLLEGEGGTEGQSCFVGKGDGDL